MFNSTTDVYTTKRKIVQFSRGLIPQENKVACKFVSQSIYGIFKSKSILLKNIAKSLNETIQLKNTIERISNNLQQPLPSSMQTNYTKKMVKSLDEAPVILVDDSDVIKPHGKKFESLGKVRDGSSKDNKTEKGYTVTEMVGLTANKKQPVSLYSHIHSSAEKGYKSTNDVLFQGLEQVIGNLCEKATFVFERGYDMNALFDFMYGNEQNFVVRLTEKRKLFWKGKWFKSSTLRDSRKGKIKTNLTFREYGKEKKETVYISHLNIKITASKTTVNLILVYGLGKKPMMLATNKAVRGKEDAFQIVRTYMPRWRIEEYFRFKKNHFGFEDFRVRSLVSINNLNQLLTCAIGLLGLLADKLQTSVLSRRLIHNARSLRRDIQFHYYQLAEGVVSTLEHAKQGIQGWFRTRNNSSRQLKMKLEFIT